MDAGINAQTIMLGRGEQNLGGCILSSVKRDELAALWSYPLTLRFWWCSRLAKPAEKVVIEALGDAGISSIIATRKVCTMCQNAHWRI